LKLRLDEANLIANVTTGGEVHGHESQGHCLPLVSGGHSM